MNKKRLSAIVLLFSVVTLSWAPPCNFGFAPNDCKDDYLETCTFNYNEATTHVDCYTNGSSCCRCTWFKKFYTCYGVLSREGQESTREVKDDYVCNSTSKQCELLPGTPGGPTGPAG